MMFLARDLNQRESFRLKALELTSEENVTIRFSEEGGCPRWVFSVKGLTDRARHSLQKWVNQETGFREGTDGND